MRRKRIIMFSILIALSMMLYSYNIGRKEVFKTNANTLISAQSTVILKTTPVIFNEVGPIPTWVKWNKKTYTITNEVLSVGEKLGVTESASLSDAQHDIYSIPNVSSDKEIAIKLLGKTYAKAVISN